MTQRITLGVSVIDEQHQVLFDHLDSLMLSLNTPASRALSQQILLDLGQYTQTHLDYEESLMAAIDFPELANHCAEHRSFVEKINQLRALTDLDDAARALTGFLIKWLREHINRSDRVYVEYALKIGAASA